MDGRTPPYFFAFDTKSKPGKMICHAVRIETIELDMDASGTFDQTKFTLFPSSYDEDKRVRQLVSAAVGYCKLNKIKPE